MSRPNHRNSRRNVVKPQMEKLEIRWLLSQAHDLNGMGRTRDRREAEIGDGLGRTVSAEFARWEAHHPDAAGSGVVALEAFEVRTLKHDSLGPWGGLRLLVQMERQGDHQFDELYQRLSGRFERWAARHPVQARALGLNPFPLATPVTTIGPGLTTSGSAASPAGSGTTGSLANPAQPISAGSSPDLGSHPLIVTTNGWALYQNCNCTTVNDVAPEPSGPCCGTPPEVPSPNGDLLTYKMMDSDANLATGELLQNHQLATYQALGELDGIDLRYTSLQADPEPIVIGQLLVNTDVAGGTFTSATLALSVGGTSQGSPITVSSIPGNGIYLVELPITGGASVSTGIKTIAVTFKMNLTSGYTSTDVFTNSTMIVNGIGSPFGAGWSIGGMQQITLGGSGTLMITDGNDPPEEFTSSGGDDYTGSADDTSTLTYNATTTNYTRTYHDGSSDTFNSYGVETSSTDTNGNTTTYGYSGDLLQTITDPTGQTTTLAYDGSGQLSTVTEPGGRVTTITVDSSGDLTEIVDPDGATTQYGYNSLHEMTSETDPNGSTATVTYNSFGQMTQENLLDGTSTVKLAPAEDVDLVGWGDTLSTLAGTMSYEATVTDPDGAMTTVVLDNMGGIIREIDGNGGVTTIMHDANDWPTVVEDPMGRITSYTYDSYGDITEITQPGGSSEYLTYDDSLGVPTEIKDFNGNTTTFVLDSHGNVTEEEQPGGVDQEWTYNSAGQALTYTDGNGSTTSYAYDSLGRLTTITEPGAGSQKVEFTYDSAGDETSVTDEVGDTTTYTYDEMGRILTEQNPVQALAGKDTAYTYDVDGNLTSITDANGDTTTYTYNARNELASVTDALDGVTTYVYDADGNVTSAIDPLGNRTTYTYDNDNNMLSAEDSLGTTTYAYDADDELTSETDPNGNATSYGYNSLGEETSVTLAGTPSTTYTYDEDGNLLTVTDPDSDTTTYVYNALGEETSMTNADGDETQYTYDGDGNVLTETDGLDHTTTYTYDAMDDELTETDPSGGGTTSYTYDAAGDLTSVTDPDNNVTSYTFNAAHEAATQTSPTGGITTYTYDLVGNLTESVNPDGHEIQYGYDADNEETSETWVNPLGGTPLDVFDYTYNADGELTAISDDNSAYQYTYNAEGEVTSQGDVGSPDLPTVTLTYSYDPDGHETSMSDSLGGVVSYTYNAQDDLTNETLSGTGISAEAVAFTYDAAGNMTGLTRYSNLAETSVVATTSYVYDADDQMTGITDKNSSGTTLVSYAYTYDAAGLVSQETRTWDSEADTDTLDYTYTNNDQLTSVTHSNASFANESFSWDANGNETGTGYTTSTGNEQTASPGYTYTYDADGNMITMTQTSTGYVWTYTYNYANLMTGAVEKTSGGTTLEQVTYTYDALDNRIGMDENGTQTWTLYDGSDPIIDFSSSGTLEMRYLNGPAGDLVDTVLACQTSGGTVSWYLPDRLGTIRDLINNSGSIIDHVDYSAFGTVLDESNPSNGDRMMGFAGLERDNVTGLNLAVFREENPATGRWVSEDPLGFAAGDTNLDRYVGNGPTSGIDSRGTIFTALPIIIAPNLFGPANLPVLPPAPAVPFRPTKPARPTLGPGTPPNPTGNNRGPYPIATRRNPNGTPNFKDPGFCPPFIPPTQPKPPRVNSKPPPENGNRPVAGPIMPKLNPTIDPGGNGGGEVEPFTDTPNL